MREPVNHPLSRRFKLNVDTIETLDDVKQILKFLDIRLQTTNPAWEEIGQFFTIEVVPRGYMLLRQKIGDEGIAKLTYEEIEEQCHDLLNSPDNEHSKT
jgi:hypothetical protein|tara:strand:- start:424 stop:720 length:297 start_codon:yes stop_codon:yes gene_type:complete